MTRHVPERSGDSVNDVHVCSEYEEDAQRFVQHMGQMLSLWASTLSMEVLPSILSTDHPPLPPPFAGSWFLRTGRNHSPDQWIFGYGDEQMTI